MRNRHQPTLAFRLTLWYGGIFTVSVSILFAALYYLMEIDMQRRMDEELTRQVTQFSTLLSAHGIETAKRMMVIEAQAAGVKKIFFRLLYPNGEIFSSSSMDYWQDIGVSREAIRRLVAERRPAFETIRIPGKREKARILYARIGQAVILQLGQSTEVAAGFMEAFRRIFLLALAVLTAFSAFIGWFMARRALSGVEAVTRTARQISEGDLKKRVPVNPSGDEIARLAATFNRMLDRIEALIAGIREMSDNIAHDLRSPVTRIRGLAEVTLTTGNNLAEYQSMAAGTVEECDRLLDMIRTMLQISEAEAGVGKLQLESIDMSRLVREACELFRPSAEDKGLLLSCEAPEEAFLAGDIRKLQRMVANLLDNGIKYTGPGGSISVSLGRQAGEAVLSVTDSGIGISEKDLPHIFERFYRTDPSRSEAGVGLGLSLARAVAEAHRGRITAESRPGMGSTFTVVLPMSRE